MKTTILTVLVFLPSFVLACAKGCTEYEGNCACEPPSADTQTLAPMPQGVVSDEKPSRHPEPAWQRGEVHADTPPSVAAKDALADEEKAKAEADGKAAAGLK